MSIESSFLASSYLKNRLNGLSSTEAVSSVNSTLKTKSSEPIEREFSISASDNQYLVLKDTVDKYTKHTTLVQISSTSLEKLGDYLVKIQEKVTQLESALLDDPSRVRISSELTNLENDLSSYLGESLKSASEKILALAMFRKNQKQSFSMR